MRRGRKIADPGAKKLAGTFRKDRHADIAPIAAASLPSAPVMPAYLSEGARQVWAEEVRRVTALGTTDADSSTFARYCELEANFRRAIKNGDDFPTGVLLTELRRHAELFGIAGGRSRLTKTGASDEKTGRNPFQIRQK